MARPETSTLWSFPDASENISVFNLPLSPGFSPPILMFHMLDTPQIGHFSITDSSLVAVVLIQKSIVKSFVPKLPAVLPKLIWLSVPLKSNACPTMPSVNEIPVKEPLSVPTRSLPLPLPGHQLTRPDGGVTQPEGDGHFPALPAWWIAAISSADRARLKTSISSSWPVNGDVPSRSEERRVGKE